MPPPTNPEKDPKTVLEYAVYIGIDPGREAFLLWIAEDGIQAALPPHYSQHADDRGEVCSIVRACVFVCVRACVLVCVAP
jgi:hypothetical protein